MDKTLEEIIEGLKDISKEYGQRALRSHPEDYHYEDKIKILRLAIEKLEAKVDVKKLAFIIKDSKLPFFECITKERRDEAYFDIAVALKSEVIVLRRKK